jgi:hypothetical protein
VKHNPIRFDRAFKAGIDLLNLPTLAPTIRKAWRLYRRIALQRVAIPQYV